MTIATAPKLETTHPPLARDTAGNLLSIPQGTAAFAAARETTGRPRDVRGPDKLRVRFPLNTSSEDLADLCGSGVYRIYALDALGEQLGDEHVARWDLTSGRDVRNASLDQSAMQRMSSIAAPALAHTGASDLRFALETMAQMMRTNSDALRVVAESQVDLAKAIATAKGLPRNAQFPPAAALAAVAANDREEQDDEDDEHDEVASAAPTNIYDVLLPFTQEAAKLTPMLMSSFSGGQTPPKKSGTVVRPPLTLAGIFDWRKIQDNHSVDEEPAAQSVSPEELDKTLAAKAMAVMKLLSPPERARMMQLFPKLREDAEIMQLVKNLLAMSDEDACTWIQTNLPELEARFQ